ncbi:hypothetical protein CHS0354_019137 [Potamilus streckersoni]|uniref:Uncharacterized protein n=1 Tax=Potamilus streckersoni TaxID=2493646 RepID=A0AAE0T095_9BIVA|nr:hypothetical protein CHS0354_019137 [Potamilus streckersoni]
MGHVSRYLLDVVFRVIKGKHKKPKLKVELGSKPDHSNFSFTEAFTTSVPADLKDGQREINGRINDFLTNIFDSLASRDMQYGR